jgi:hypothetical protein
MSARPAMDPDSAEYANDDWTWNEETPMSRCIKRTILCPHEDESGVTCEKALTVELSPFIPGTRWDPPEDADDLDRNVVLAALENDHD